MKRDGRISLNARLLMVQLGSLCVALAIFLCGMLLGSWILNNYYLSPEASLARKQAYIRELESYIRENDLRSTDDKALESWAKARKYVYLAIYRDESPVFETGGYDTSRANEENARPAAQEADSGVPLPDDEGLYHLTFADGVFRVSVAEFSETPYYDFVVISSLVLACLAMMLINLSHNHHITSAITRLSREVQWVEQGSSDVMIHSGRKDEIGDLARSVEAMRRSIIQRMQSEQDAWAANSGLITAISHDVRTPLTALIGYLDLLEGKQYQNDAQMERYLTASRQKAQQLKGLTDELFRYFLVFATPELKLEKQVYDAAILTEQLLGERIIRLQEKGYTVQTTMLQQPCRVELDVQYLQRVLDNLFSNIEKHADKSRPVHILARVQQENLVLLLANSVPSAPSRAESTKIGLQTCRRIIHALGGRFETQREDGRYLAEVFLPLVDEKET